MFNVRAFFYLYIKKSFKIKKKGEKSQSKIFNSEYVNNFKKYICVRLKRKNNLENLIFEILYICACLHVYMYKLII